MKRRSRSPEILVRVTADKVEDIASKKNSRHVFILRFGFKTERVLI